MRGETDFGFLSFFSGRDGPKAESGGRYTELGQNVREARTLAAQYAMFKERVWDKIRQTSCRARLRRTPTKISRSQRATWGKRFRRSTRGAKRDSRSSSTNCIRYWSGVRSRACQAATGSDSAGKARRLRLALSDEELRATEKAAEADWAKLEKDRLSRQFNSPLIRQQMAICLQALGARMQILEAVSRCCREVPGKWLTRLKPEEARMHFIACHKHSLIVPARTIPNAHSMRPRG